MCLLGELTVSVECPRFMQHVRKTLAKLIGYCPSALRRS